MKKLAYRRDVPILLLKVFPNLMLSLIHISLEMIDKESIMFSTTNPNNRYIHMKNVRESNNLRNMYIRSITLGGQSEEIYEETDSLKIARAFRKAGQGVRGE